MAASPGERGAAASPVVMLDEAKMGKRHDADGYYAGSEAVTAFRKVC